MRPPAPLHTAVCDVAQWGIFFIWVIFMDVKPFSTYRQQIEKLVSRGCVIDDIKFAEDVLQRINYYRLTAYFLPFRDADGSYKEGTSFKQIYEIYEFDRKMRNILFPIIEEIELMLRAQLSYYHSHKYGPLGYLDKNTFNKYHKHDRFRERIDLSIRNNKNQLFVKHHQEKYEGQFPLWVVLELSSFGELSYFYSDLLKFDKKNISNSLFGTVDTNVSSWLMCITYLRNYCAHYSRLYYNIFPAKPATPKKFPYELQRRLFDYILVLSFLYKDKIRWNLNFVPLLNNLIDEYASYIDLMHIGFPQNWKSLLTIKEKVIWGYNI